MKRTSSSRLWRIEATFVDAELRPIVQRIAKARAHKPALLAILAGKRPQRGHCWTCGVHLPLEPDVLYGNCAGCASREARQRISQAA